MEKLMEELEKALDVGKQEQLTSLKTDWEAGQVFHSDLSFQADFLAQVEDLRKASLVFVEGILGKREITSSFFISFHFFFS